jgi:ferredoxin
MTPASRSSPRRRAAVTALAAAAVLLRWPSSAVYGFSLTPPVHPRVRGTPKTTTTTRSSSSFPPRTRQSPRRSIAAAAADAAESPEENGVEGAREDETAPPPPAAEGEDCIDVSSDPRLRRVRLSRALGIDWGTDLSFSFVYVRGMEPSGSASLSGAVGPGDQICELRPVLSKAGDAPVNLVGASFDAVMGAFASLGREVREVDLVFFRGTKEELRAACAGGKSPGGGGGGGGDAITITVVQDRGPNQSIRIIEARAGCNVRQVLTDNGINVYQSVTRWTNCKGKQLCGTCIVNVAEGGGATNRKSLDEASTLRENPDSYRLSCVTFAYGDVMVETFPPVKAAQWTR